LIVQSEGFLEKSLCKFHCPFLLHILQEMHNEGKSEGGDENRRKMKKKEEKEKVYRREKRRGVDSVMEE